jgi:hypothetical protein
MRDGEKYRPQEAEWLAPVRALVRPVSEGLFAGILDIRKIPSFSDRLKFRLSVASGVWSEGDHRDWEAIHAWANSLQGKIEEPFHQNYCYCSVNALCFSHPNLLALTSSSPAHLVAKGSPRKNPAGAG